MALAIANGPFSPVSLAEVVHAGYLREEGMKQNKKPKPSGM